MAIQVSVKYNVKVNHIEFRQLLAVYCSLMSKNVADVVRNTARLFCRDMIQYTPPFSGSGPSNSGRSGMDSVAQKKGQANVSRDIRKIFAPLAQTPASQVAQYGNVGIFSAWMNAKAQLPPPHNPAWVFQLFPQGAYMGQGEFELFKKYETNKNETGIANFVMGANESQIAAIHKKRRGPTSYKVMETRTKYYVDDWKVVERYTKRVQTRVGTLKSGWYYAGLDLGKMPKVSWIANQGNKYKICIKNLIGNDPQVTIGTTNGRNYSGSYYLMRSAMNHRAFVMRNEILYFFKNNPSSLLQAIQQISQGYNIVNKNP